MIWFWIEIGGREAEIHRRELVVGRFELDDRRFRLRWKVVADLRHFRLNLRQRGVGVVIELQVHGDRAEALSARRFHVVDAVGAGDDPLEGRRDEPAHEIRVRADVQGRDADHGDVAARILPDAEGADRLQARNQDDQVDDDREDRSLDEKVGELHQLFSGLGFGLFAGCTLLLTSTAAPLRSLKTPDVTTSSPGLHAGDDRDLVAARATELHELLPHAFIGLPVLILEVGHDEHRVAVRCVADR